MRGTKIPFAEDADVKQLGAAGAIPKAFSNSTLDATWVTLTPPPGASVGYGIIGDPALPTLPSTLKGVMGYDASDDQIKFWTGSTWITYG